MLSECMRPKALKPMAYLERYERHFSPMRSSVRTVLELGIHEGESLLMWRDYFPDAIIAGLDINASPIDGERLRAYRGSQDDLELLDRIAAECAPEGFDIIIDDCAHIGKLAKRSFWHLFDNRLKETGVYVIEDWGTGYWPQWPGGRQFEPAPDRDDEFPSHTAGMPGFVKQLIDECAITDIRAGGSSYQSPHKLIGWMDVAMGQVFVYPFKLSGWAAAP
jgi:hypothetical protein